MRTRTKVIGMLACVLLASVAIIFGLYHGLFAHRQSEIKEAQLSLKNEIDLTVSLIHMGKTANERYTAGLLLCELTRGDAAKRVDDASLDSIIALLDSEDDSVRSWISLCLGHNFGPRAKRAVPKLLKILNESDCNQPHGVAPDVCAGLKQIGAEMPPKCRPCGVEW
jgi:hypothetical protein